MSDASAKVVPPAIRDAAKHGELVVFVGAGASRLCGSPDWPGFAFQVVKLLQRAGAIDFLEAEQLSNLGDPRRTLSIARELAGERGVPITTVEYDQLLHPGSQEPEGRELYELLGELRPVFVTTNYDRWLDAEGPKSLTTGNAGAEVAEPLEANAQRPKYFRREDLTADKLSQRGAVIHLHGSYTDPASMVVSLRDYIEHYSHDAVQTFLTEMFRNYTVLFLGYGLSELEILDHIVRSNPIGPVLAETERRCFILYPHRSTEAKQTEFISRFYWGLGVEVIRYCIDKNGYVELLNVLKAWAPQLDIREPTLIEIHRRLERYIENGGVREQREAALRLVQRNPALQAYFFNALKEPVWFDELDAAGYFDAENNPHPTVVEAEGGRFVKADDWPALRYLERIAPVVDRARAERIVQILRGVTEGAKEEELDNWRTWWSLARVLSDLPLGVIGLEDIGLVQVWLGGRVEANMVGRELGKRLLPRLLESSDPSDSAKAMALVRALTVLRARAN